MNQSYRYTIDGELFTWAEIRERAKAAGIDSRTAQSRLENGKRTWAELLLDVRIGKQRNLIARRKFVHNCVRRAQR